jgi:hypothetical protein
MWGEALDEIEIGAACEEAARFGLECIDQLVFPWEEPSGLSPSSLRVEAGGVAAASALKRRLAEASLHVGSPFLGEQVAFPAPVGGKPESVDPAAFDEDGDGVFGRPFLAVECLLDPGEQCWIVGLIALREEAQHRLQLDLVWALPSSRHSYPQSPHDVQPRRPRQRGRVGRSPRRGRRPGPGHPRGRGSGAPICARAGAGMGASHGYPLDARGDRARAASGGLARHPRRRRAAHGAAAAAAAIGHPRRRSPRPTRHFGSPARIWKIAA